MPQLEQMRRKETEQWGRILDQRPKRLRGQTVGMVLAEKAAGGENARRTAGKAEGEHRAAGV